MRGENGPRRRGGGAGDAGDAGGRAEVGGDAGGREGETESRACSHRARVGTETCKLKRSIGGVPYDGRN